MSLLAGLRERRHIGELAVELEASRVRVVVLEEMATAMLGCVRSLVLDIEEIGAPALQVELGKTLGRLRAGDDPAALSEETERCHRQALIFAERERIYLDHRDTEVRRIIDVLTEGLTAVSSGAANYHRRLLENGSRFEAAARLSDLVRMRAAITSEVQGLRSAVAERQCEESKTTAALRCEVDQLRRKVEHARNEARTDALTQAANRAAFDDELARRCDLAASGGDGFSLLLADIDHFKQINDSYGHPVGDRVLHALVTFLRDRVRRGDMIARWGGEEFAVLLPTASLRVAYAKARTLVSQLADCKWTIDQARQLSFSISVGVTAWRPGDQPATIVERVDQALYQAKHAGRSRAIKA